MKNCNKTLTKNEKRSENNNEIVMTKTEKVSEIRIENKFFNSLSLARNPGHRELQDQKEFSKLKVQLKNKAESQLKKSFQILSQNNIIEWKADQEKEIRIIC